MQGRELRHLDLHTASHNSQRGYVHYQTPIYVSPRSFVPCKNATTEMHFATNNRYFTTRFLPIFSLLSVKKKNRLN